MTRQIDSTASQLNKGTMRLREARLSDIETLKHWDEQPHVIESDPNDNWNWEEMLRMKYDWLELLIAEIDGTPIGFIQIINPAQEESHYWGEISEGYRALDIWIGEFENTGRGYGSQMMKLALYRCFSCSDVHTVLIDPLSTNTRAIKFYERIGFAYVEDRYFGKDHCKVYKVSRSEIGKV